MTPDPRQEQTSQLALIVQQPGKPQQVLVRYLALILNYRYGLDIMVVNKFVEAFAAMQRHHGRFVCTFVVQNRNVVNRAAIAPLNDDGAVPLFFILPQALIQEHERLCFRMTNVYFCAWENAFRHTGSSLHKVMAATLADRGIGDLVVGNRALPPEQSEERLQRRLRKLTTLPTLPDVALHIIRMVEDPNATVDQLEQVLLRDPAVVHKLLHVVNTSMFAGTSGRYEWSLQESIVRLGRRKVGAIALQIKLMNSLLRPQESQFDLPRFWRHSVACALITDQLCTHGHVHLDPPIPFASYWTAGLLHDIGKLVQGFLFWSHFEDVLHRMGADGTSFREAETKLGDQANHEFLGRVLLERANLNGSLAEAVGQHDSIDASTEPLVWVVHLANNLAKELGLGYTETEEIRYSERAMRCLQLNREAAHGLAQELKPKITAQVNELVKLCLGQD